MTTRPPVPLFPRPPLLAVMFALGLAACTSLNSSPALEEAIVHAEQQGFSAQRLHAGDFELTSWIRTAPGEHETMALYIEGDGAAWPSPYLPPANPTPMRPLALSLAAADPAPAVAYLGRPCQYLPAAELAKCNSAYWTERRFAPEVLTAYEEALEQMKSRFGIRRWQLIGYSGGGVIATLLAQRRKDVSQLITIAAPLAVSSWLAWHGASELSGSLDPAADRAPLPWAIHFSGSNDRIVPPEIGRSFIKATSGTLVIMPDFDHQYGWLEHWPELLRQARQPAAKR